MGFPAPKRESAEKKTLKSHPLQVRPTNQPEKIRKVTQVLKLEQQVSDVYGRVSQAQPSQHPAQGEPCQVPHKPNQKGRAAEVHSENIILAHLLTFQRFLGKFQRH